MAVQYFCRHCGYKVGEINEPHMSVERLGFQQLSENEQQEMITYSEDGNIKVKTICEHCEEALQHNPEYHQLRTFIQ